MTIDSITQRRTRLSSWAAVLAVACLVTPAAHAQDLLRVNGQAITLEQAMAINPAAASNLQVRQQVAEQLARLQLLADSVKDVTPAVQARITAGQGNLRRQALAQLATDEFLQAHPVAEEKLREEYAKIISALPQKQYWVRWIIVATPEKADALLAKLRSGEGGFANLAIEESTGQNAQLGGALGWQSEQSLPAAVLGVVRKLKPEQVAGPIALENGFAIVQLLATRETPKPNFAVLKPQIEEQLRNVALQSHIAELAKSAKIENLMQATDSGRSASGEKIDGK